jgi:DNA replicative helicase MCM subunit Mcm2 (Cdc46/Mcm family)
VKPGDRVQCMGIFKAMAPGQSVAATSTSGVFSTVLLVNNVKQIGKDNGTVKMSGDTIRHIRERTYTHHAMRRTL